MPTLRFPDYLQELLSRMAHRDRSAFVESGMVLGRLFRQFFLGYGFFEETAERLAESAVFRVSGEALDFEPGVEAEVWINEQLHAIAHGELLELQNRSQQQYVARDLQSRMFRLASDVAGIQINAAYRAAQVMTGDFHDAFLLSDGTLLIVIGDVAGKGPDSAMYAALIIGMIRALALTTSSEIALLCGVNRLLLEASLQPKYSTLLLAKIAIPSRLVSLATGAAGNQLVISSESVRCVPLSGHAVGMTDSPEFHCYQFELLPGESLVLLTDGITDQFDESNSDQYGDDRLRAVLQHHPGRTLSSIPESILADVQRFQGAGVTTDDQTVISIAFVETDTTLVESARSAAT